MVTKQTNKKPSFIEENWMWFLGGAIVIGIILFAMIKGDNSPTTEDRLRQFESALMRYKPLQEYDEAERKSIISCVFYLENVTNYRNYLRQKNQADSDSFISTRTPVPSEDIYTSLSKYVDGDNNALLAEERNQDSRRQVCRT